MLVLFLFGLEGFYPDKTQPTTNSIAQPMKSSKVRSTHSQCVRRMLKLSQVHEMPKTCRLASGMLLNVVTGYYEMRAQQHRFSSTVLGLKFVVDETNGLQKLHEFMTR